ncbi:mite allergen Der p 3-like [Chrysoperla carnea]|uniref:mite allergen Der p 3-like n=1 Tax=Chrysoperla carnea TaxID=189513 RepID=UPI001D071E15|nr:mite allergen Der p 3-like [Chrysoperla carnea]
MILIGGLLFFASITTSYSGILTPLIVGGENAEWGDIPYIVSLRSDSLHTCGGVLISKDWIITAAHCVTSSIIKYTIQYGVLNISSNANDKSVIEIEKIIIHEKFDSFTTENNIAALKLKEPVKFSKYVSAAVLPEQNEEVPEVDNALLAGWGQLYTNGPISTQLQKVELAIIEQDLCQGFHFLQIFDTNLCAGILQGGKGQCKNDAGSPLTVNGKVVGIDSWSGKPCGNKQLPGIFTRVASYRDWIRSTTNV